MSSHWQWCDEDSWKFESVLTNIFSTYIWCRKSRNINNETKFFVKKSFYVVFCEIFTCPHIDNDVMWIHENSNPCWLDIFSTYIWCRKSRRRWSWKTDRLTIAAFADRRKQSSGTEKSWRFRDQMSWSKIFKTFVTDTFYIIVSFYQYFANILSQFFWRTLVKKV
jgi:hypothetical protein